MTQCFPKTNLSNRINKLRKEKNFFAVIDMKPVDIVFKKNIDKIKQVNQKYTTTILYQCINATNKTKYD